MIATVCCNVIACIQALIFDGTTLYSAHAFTYIMNTDKPSSPLICIARITLTLTYTQQSSSTTAIESSS
jgi:hypothetical protein